EELGDDGLAKSLPVHGDEYKAHEGELFAELSRATAVGRVEDEAADLRRAIVVEADAQHLVDEVPIDGLRVALLLEHIEIDMRRLARAVLRHDLRGTDDLAGLGV